MFYVNEKTIKAICNPTRLKIIKCLSEKDKTVSELISRCDLSQSAVSQHLTKLKDAKIVKAKKEGREVFYSLINHDLAKVSSILLGEKE